MRERAGGSNPCGPPMHENEWMDIIALHVEEWQLGPAGDSVQLVDFGTGSMPDEDTIAQTGHSVRGARWVRELRGDNKFAYSCTVG